MNFFHMQVKNTLNSCQNTRPMRDTQYVLLYSRANFAGMECFLDTATNAYILANIDSVEHAWSVLKQMLTDGCEQFIPKFKVPAKPTPRWFNSNVRHLLNCTHTLRRLHKRKPTTNNYEKLQRMETCLRTSIEASRDEYLQRIVSQFQANPKKLYEYLKHLSNSKFKPQFIYRPWARATLHCCDWLIYCIDDDLYQSRSCQTCGIWACALYRCYARSHTNKYIYIYTPLAEPSDISGYTSRHNYGCKNSQA